MEAGVPKLFDENTNPRPCLEFHICSRFVAYSQPSPDVVYVDGPAKHEQGVKGNLCRNEPCEGTYWTGNGKFDALL